ncbi:nuA4 complex subunit EAF3 homolog isoform X2 [Drosophila busckii]|uniref:nuA4 complex subunit EAF3 homolog isoform X2 n=1 Tax=Drosophila busckii TaxID=30019 RepID=UPI00083EF9C5|nr:nuA4 complex subunit EAF3 homolog isoform X2 [Drosophila busckii]
MGEVKTVKIDNWNAMDGANLFTDGERVLCFHGPLIYEAKVLKTKTEITPVEYYIHYAGWSKNWDEWVPENRVLKYNDENIKRQKELARLCGERQKKENKKLSAKAKRMENESRASTPSKDGNTSLSLTGGNSNSSVSSTPTPVGVAPNAKHESVSTNSTTSSSTSITTSRGNRKSIHTARPTTPQSASSDKKTENSTTPMDTTEDEITMPLPTKTKRMSSHTSERSVEQSRASSTGVSSDSSAQSQQQPPAAAAAGATAVSGNDAPCVESEETYIAKLEVKIKIPDELKHYLTDDWYAVVREHKLLELPAKVTVQQIVDQYLAYKKSVKSTSASKEVAINDVLDGVLEYFNVMLGSQLLYKFERTQYADIMQKHPDTSLSELYGSFHLLRLFVRMGSMLSYSSLDQPAMQALLVHLHDFLKFLVKNSAMYFSMNNFINVDPEYVRNAQ